MVLFFYFRLEPHGNIHGKGVLSAIPFPPLSPNSHVCGPIILVQAKWHAHPHSQLTFQR